MIALHLDFFLCRDANLCLNCICLLGICAFTFIAWVSVEDRNGSVASRDRWHRLAVLCWRC